MSDKIIPDQTNKTGYPHIDKPWMKYYNNPEIKKPNLNIAKYIRELNKDRMSLIAETYYGRTFTYYDFFKGVDDASKALTAVGAKKGNNVFSLLPTIPEAGQLWLGAAQIGVISDFADPRPDTLDLKANAQKILEILKYEKADYIVALDECYLHMLVPIENELKKMGYKNIIVVSAGDSMNILGIIDYLRDVIKYNSLRNASSAHEMGDQLKKLKFYEALYQKISAMKKSKRMMAEAIKSSPIEIIKYTDLIKSSKNLQFEEVNDASLISYIGHTSGTSGARPKPIPLTNENLISSIEQTISGGFGVAEGERILHELPFFSPLGGCNNFLIDLACGANLVDVPEFEISEFGYLIKKIKPNAFLGTPSWLASLTKCNYLQNEDLSFITKAIYGGDSMTAQDEINLNNWLKEHGSNAMVEKGHGMSEYCGGGTYSKGKWSKYESIGIPFPGTTYGIVDPSIEDRLVPIKDVDKEGFISGELVVSSDAVTPGVLNGNVIVQHFEMDGKSYIRTRDLVKMDKDGIFYFQARKDRSFTRFDGFKVKPYEIEKEIEQDELVKYCRIVYYYDTIKKGYMPIAHIVLNEYTDNLTDDEYVEIVKSIIDEHFLNNPSMSSRQIPSKFRFRNELPLTKNSKISYSTLIAEGITGDEITVDIAETNMKVGAIKVYKPNSSNRILRLVKKS